MPRRLRSLVLGLLLAVSIGVLAVGVVAATASRRILERVDYSAARERLVTGILVTGTAARPVVYVTSSDPRTGAPTRRDRAMDTNSGVVSRLTWNGTAWERLDLVRGLPHSRQDHATNGLVLDPVTNTLLVAQGSNTNRGAPSTRFALLPEYALSGAVLAIDLDRIGERTYDLPTLGGRGPFGGRGGANQAVLEPDSPVRLYATGLRNPYDLVRTRAGAVYLTQNGANPDGGSRPAVGASCTNAPREGGAHGDDTLHRLVRGGYYGHPNPTRADPANTFGGRSPVRSAAPTECGTRGARPLATFPASTNGIAEMTAGALRGDLLTVSLDGTLHRLRLDAAGKRVVAHEQVKLLGVPLDVTAQGEGDPLPGTIWVAMYLDGRGGPGGLAVLEPADLDRHGSWTRLAGSGVPRQEVSYVGLGGRFYLAGGGTAHQVYDPRSGAWSDLAPLPEKLDHIQGAVVEGRIYYVGGLRRWPDDEVGSVWAYDPAADRFSRAVPMPRPRGAGGVVAHKGQIYYAGGLHRGRAVPWLDVFDPATGRWRQLPDMPRARDHIQAVVVDERLYVIGGRDRDIGSEIAATDAFDLLTGRWITGLAPLPTPRGGYAAAVVGGEILVIGGEVPGRALPTVEAYDPSRDSWRTLPSLPTARHGIQAAVCGDTVLVAAGGVRVGGGPSDVQEAYAAGSRACGDERVDARETGTALRDGFVLGSVSGAAPVHPTSLQVGPDGRLYVAQQNGEILAYTVRRRTAGAYEVTATERIGLVRRIPNHDDDGSSAVDVGSLVTVIRDKIGL